MINKKKNNDLLTIADNKLRTSNIFNNGNIASSYNGCIASFGVSVAMSGLRPTLAIYYHKEDRKNVLEILAKMLVASKYYNFDNNVRKTQNDQPIAVNNAETLLRYAFYCNGLQLKSLQEEVVDCAIALKQVVRTYNLES